MIVKKTSLDQAESNANSQRMEGLQPTPKNTFLGALVIDGQLSADRVIEQIIEKAKSNN